MKRSGAPCECLGMLLGVKEEKMPGTRWHFSISPTLLRSYPTGQARRKECYCYAVRQNDRQLPYGSGETKGEEAWHPQGVPLHFLLLDGG